MRTGTAILVLAAVGVLAAGCSSSGTTSATNTGNGTGGSGAATTKAAAKAKVTCSQLAKTDVQGLMTSTVTSMKVSPVGTGGDGQLCVFGGSDDSQAVDVIALPDSDPALGWDQSKAQASDPVSLTGIGDEAYREGDDDSPFARHGGVLCTVSIGTISQLPGSDAMITDGTLHEGPAQETVVATALGTVCNRLFGTGSTTPDFSGLKTS
jgi:hypothetical protein